MIIRQATPADRDTIASMAVEFLADSVYSSVIRADYAHLAQLVALVIEQHVVFIAETADGVAGFLALLKLAHPMNGDLYAEELAWWVDPDWRGSSAAGRLLRAGENWARDQGLRVIKMGAPVGSPVGSHYERLGYSPLEVTYTKKL
jgi:GNAT superfamily N-acetyltransferase